MWAYAHPDFAAVSGGQCGAGRTALRAALALDTIQLPSRWAQAESVIGASVALRIACWNDLRALRQRKTCSNIMHAGSGADAAELRLLEAQLAARGAASLLPRCQAARSARWRQRQQRQQRLM